MKGVPEQRCTDAYFRLLHGFSTGMGAVGKRVGGISTINPFLPCFESTSKAYKQVKME